MDFLNFKRLKIDATEFTSDEDFIAECGGSVDYDDTAKIIKYLELVWQYAMDPSADTLCRMLEISRAEFSRTYSISIRTLENWSSGVRTPPDYLSDLLAFAVISDIMSDYNS